jgi:hypothetical protein
MSARSRAPKRLSEEALAIINAIEASSRNTQTAASLLAKALTEHTMNDDLRFAAVTKLVESIALDVKSLLETRTFTQGMVRAVVLIAASVSALVSGIILYFRGH